MPGVTSSASSWRWCHIPERCLLPGEQRSRPRLCRPPRLLDSDRTPQGSGGGPDTQATRRSASSEIRGETGVRGHQGSPGNLDLAPGGVSAAQVRPWSCSRGRGPWELPAHRACVGQNLPLNSRPGAWHRSVWKARLLQGGGALCGSQGSAGVFPQPALKYWDP